MGDTKGFDPKESQKSGFSKFLWNPNTKEFCGRTISSWAKVLIFYIIFYLCLAAFWALMLIIFKTTLNDKQPKLSLDDSRIGSNPGLGYRPRPPREKIESTLIRFKANSAKSFQHWVDDLNKYVTSYNSTKGGADQPINCNDDEKPPEPDKFCFFDYDRLIKEECTPANDYGYSRSKPCVLIKLNRIFGWEPLTYGPEDLSDPNLDPKLRNAIENVQKAKNETRSRYIYVTCQGQNPVDEEQIGPLKYYPEQGINSKYFPFLNQDNYLSPFVFVQFAAPGQGVVINVECKAWAKNIKHDLIEREGSVHFEIAVDV